MLLRIRLKMHEKTLDWAIDRSMESSDNDLMMSLAFGELFSQIIKAIDYRGEDASIFSVVDSIRPAEWQHYASVLAHAAERSQKSGDEDSYFANSVLSGIIDCKIFEVSKPKLSPKMNSHIIKAGDFFNTNIARAVRAVEDAESILGSEIFNQ